jgi:putative DNA primase/helicase
LSWQGPPVTDLRGLAHKLKGKPAGSGFVCSCPLPTHGKRRGDKNPSLSIAEGADGSLLLHCKAGCDSRDVFSALRARGLIDERPGRHDQRIKPQRPIAYFPADPVEPNRRAIELWRSSIPGEDSPLLKRYFESRSIRRPIPPTLRFIPEFEYMPRVSFPAMIAAVQAADRRIIAVQITFLHPNGARKAHVANPRKTIGAMGAGAIRLGPAGPVVGLAEGTESALSAMELFGIPAWATLGAQRLGSIRLPPEVDKVILYPDRDEAGRGAAQKAAEVYRLLRFVECKFPVEGCNDFNDELALEKSEMRGLA